MSRKMKCGKCEYISDNDFEICPQCKDENAEKCVLIGFEDEIKVAENIRGKVREPGDSRRHPSKEMFYGDDYSHEDHKFIHKERIIDRKNNEYVEKIEDKQSGNIIRNCHEPLSEHLGHGSAKNKSNDK